MKYAEEKETRYNLTRTSKNIRENRSSNNHSKHSDRNAQNKT